MKNSRPPALEQRGSIDFWRSRRQPKIGLEVQSFPRPGWSEVQELPDVANIQLTAARRAAEAATEMRGHTDGLFPL